MSFEDLWAEHKRFILAAGGGAMAFLVAISAIGTVDAEGGRIARESRRLEREIEERADLLQGREAHEAGIAKALAETVEPALRADVEFAPRPEFAPPAEGTSPHLAYHETVERVKQTRADIVRRGVPCPEDLGLPPKPAEEGVGLAIHAADVIDRVLRALAESGARSVESVRPGEVEFAPVRAPAGRGEQPEEGGAASDLVLRRIPVRIEATGSLDALAGFLERIQRPGAFLEIASATLARGATARSGDASAEAPLRLAVEVAAISLVPASEARALDPRAGAASSGAGGGRRTLRERR